MDGEGKPRVLLIITQDTKEEEAHYVRALLEGQGCAVIHLDPSVRRTVGGAEISPEQVAAAAGMTMAEVRAIGHEGKILDVMVRGAVEAALHAHDRTPLSAIFAIGGSMGTTLGCSVMRSFPYGLPKVMISTMASGFTKPHVGVKDIVMMNAVTDIAGLNSFSREIYRNGTLAVAAMARGYSPMTRADKPLVLMTTLGTTERATRRIRHQLEAAGAEVLVFHSSGAGGSTLDSIAAERDVALVLDLSVTEIIDHLHGGLSDSGPDRGRAALERGIPAIFAPGNADFIIAGPLDDARRRFPDRIYHVHNPALTAVRTGMEELEPLADHLAAMFQQAAGPVQFFLPLQGFSNHDSPDGHIHDLSIPPRFAEYLESVLPKGVPLHVIDAHFNDAEFADAIANAAIVILKERLQS